jgi:hypothetical protein
LNFRNGGLPVALYIVIVLVAVCAVEGSCAASRIVSLNMEGSLRVIGNPEKDSLFNAIFNFRLIPSGYNLEILRQGRRFMQAQIDAGDTTAQKVLTALANRFDRAYLMADSNLEYLSPHEWTGKIVPNANIELVVRCRLRRMLPTQIIGIVETSCPNPPSDTIPCATTNFFASDNLSKGAHPDTVMRKLDTIWKDGHPIIIGPVHNLKRPIRNNLKLQTDSSVPLINKVIVDSILLGDSLK